MTTALLARIGKTSCFYLGGADQVVKKLTNLESAIHATLKQFVCKKDCDNSCMNGFSS